ncbi:MULTISPECIES: MarR family winged helix-turn-helix transcriptional regulator [Brevundimonas]|uniref:DNA-binding transcriptional regulator, MarR family n=1 Tax=Brevundimonas viscosa TaxID=871741 RepID=A0A1I6P596_9CAUL|nr:MarR family transcriptional regulator [Brevundimonas viscosa]SFS35394.1 DNA-binding transcriptional regulator, MarR family [Brevundimonas viscosa]
MRDISAADPPLPTEPDPTAELVRSVRRIAQAIDVRSREIARLTGLTLPQLLVLQSIRALGEVSTHAVSRDVSLSAPTVVAVLDRLEARGLIVRYRSTSDRRIVHARLTPDGEAALRDAPGLLRPGAMRALADLPPERREALAAAIRAVTDLIAAEAPA